MTGAAPLPPADRCRERGVHPVRDPAARGLSLRAPRLAQQGAHEAPQGHLLPAAHQGTDQRGRKRPQIVLGRFRLDIQENSFMERVVQPWHRAMVEPLSLELFKSVWMWQLGTGVSGGLGSAGEWLGWISEGFSSLNHSMIPGRVQQL